MEKLERFKLGGVLAYSLRVFRTKMVGIMNLYNHSVRINLYMGRNMPVSSKRRIDAKTLYHNTEKHV